jgi:hypothetical protein
VTSGHLFQVGARTEVVAGPGDDRHPDVVVGVRLHHGVVEPHQHLAVDGVHPVGTVERHDQNMADPFG